MHPLLVLRPLRFDSLAEYLARWFKSIGHETWFFGYVTVLIAMSLVVYVVMPETRHSAEMPG